MTNRHDENSKKQQLIAQLHAIVDAENQKPAEQRDFDLIKECVDFFMELENYEPITPQQHAQAKEKLLHYADERLNNKPKPLKKRISFKIALAAACCAITLLVANFAATAYGIDTVSILKEFGDRIITMLAGEKVEYKGFTIIKNGVSKTYDSIEECLEKEKLNVLYPTKLPDGIELTSVHSIAYKNRFDIFYVTNNTSVSFSLEYKPDVEKLYLNDSTFIKKEINGYTCYCPSYEAVQYDFFYNGYLCTVTAQSHEDAIEIINNLKEFKQNG